jgi:hypothetical protein
MWLNFLSKKDSSYYGKVKTVNKLIGIMVKA